MRTSRILASAALVASMAPAFAQDQGQAPAAPALEFHSYARLGFSTSLNVFEPASDTQGYGPFGAWASRHIRNSNGEMIYVRPELSYTLTGGGKFVISADFEEGVSHLDSDWSGENLRIRDAYLELPLAGGTIWAGSRRVEFDDIRLFDKRPLSPDALFGAGIRQSLIDGITYQADIGVNQGQKYNGGATAADAPSVPRQLTTISQKLELSGLAANTNVKPVLIVTHLSKVDAEEAGRRGVANPQDQDAEVQFKGGVIVNNWGMGVLEWANHFVWAETARAAGGEADDKDITYGLAESASLKFGDSFGLLGAFAVKYKTFKNDQQKFKVENDALVADGTSTTKSTTSVSVGVQPVYMVTDRFHAALDLGYTAHFVPTSTNDANLLSVTPILRYAMNDNTIGTPQIFTSLTYGKYNVEAKADGDGERSDTLITTATGLEVWF